MIHYIGDSTLSKPYSHGNALKQTRLHFRTKPSVLRKAEEKVEENTSHKVYKQMINEATNGNEATSKPKDLQQVQNLRKKVKQENMLSKDAIINAHVIAYDDNGFVWQIQTHPDLLIIIGLKELLNELSQLYKDVDPEHLLSYDTTFQLGDFYLSALLYKHTAFLEKPAVPALFLIHNRKYEEHHKRLFDELKKHVSEKRLHQKVIAVDNEKAITNAIVKSDTYFKLVIANCWRHAGKDVEHWVSKHEGSKKDQLFYKDELFDILKSKTVSEMKEKICEKRKKWSEAFVQYFEDQIEPRLENMAICMLEGKVEMDESGITTN